MLPTKGYFQDIECPYYESTCNRPYCHFRHRKKGQEPIEEIVAEPVKEIEVPVYKPTPKSELANIRNHIPISYVPDLAFRPDRARRPIPKFERPTYKPTPLSILSSANKRSNSLDDDHEDTSEEIKAIREIKINIASVKYNPEISLNTNIDFEDLTAEFDLLDDIIEEPQPTAAPVKPAANETKENSKKTEEQPKKSDKSTKSEKSERHSSKSSSKSKSKSHSSSSSSSKSKHHKNDAKEKHGETKRSKSKERDKDRHTSRHKSSRDKERSSKSKDNTHRSSSSTKSKSHKDKKPKEAEKKPRKSSDSDDFTEPPEPIETYSDIDLEDEEEVDTMMECYKIFNEYRPPSPKVQPPEPPQITIEETPDDLSAKKRIAHYSGTTDNTPKLTFSKPKSQLTAAQVMANRFKAAKAAHEYDEEKHIINEMKHTAPKRPPPSLLDAARKLKLQKLSKPAPVTNLVDSILNGARGKPKKIAPAQNVTSIQRAKARLDDLAKQKAAESLSKTPAQIVKGAKRVAHVPDVSLSDIPDVLHADKSKLPINVRTRFLTMIADECVKLYLIKDEAYTRALNEEFSCYEKCKVPATYKNSAMLAVSRLRKELLERDKQGLGPIGLGESSEKDKASDLKGRAFYGRIQKYVLTNEELDIHGYPNESAAYGRAVIINRRNKPTGHLEENQRKCARCSRLYLVDEVGFVVHPEECIYHPLKKRTLRGEQTYLCCKSNDDAGCATSNTHVSESDDGGELEGFQMTMAPERDDDPRSYAVYALDCEMCYTIKGLELTRVTIVDSECKTVYESLVKPLNPIIDYNTNFSGITREQMERTSTSILQVQANILHLCNSKTILIGHSLESDMKALKIIHRTVIDTSVLFPHKMGLPHKRALRVLASDFLKKIIQNNINGHDSAEDAITCMDLVKWKLKEELKVRGVK